MSEQSRKILADALELAPAERAVLVEEILSSFDSPEIREMDAEWVKEAEDRIDAYERGELSALPANEVFDRLKQKQNK